MVGAVEEQCLAADKADTMLLFPASSRSISADGLTFSLPLGLHCRVGCSLVVVV